MAARAAEVLLVGVVASWVEEAAGGSYDGIELLGVRVSFGSLLGLGFGPFAVLVFSWAVFLQIWAFWPLDVRAWPVF